jgi:drug/metabolite transporter (DMT)-like permease
MNRGALQIVAGAACFGLIPLFLTACSSDSAILIACGRAAFASLFAAIFLVIRKNSFRLTLKQFCHYFIWSMQLTLAIVFYFLSIQCAGHAIPGMVIGLQPLFVAMFAFILFRERISPRTWMSCALALVGIVLLSGFLPGKEVEGTGLLYALFSAFLLGINFTYHLKFLHGESAYRLVFFQNLFQLPILAVVLFFVPFHFVLSDLLPFALLGVICTGAAYILIYAGSKSVKKEHIGILQLIENVIPVFTGIFFAHEQLTWSAVAGISLILFAGFWNVAKKMNSPALLLRITMAHKLKLDFAKDKEPVSAD